MVLFKMDTVLNRVKGNNLVKKVSLFCTEVFLSRHQPDTEKMLASVFRNKCSHSWGSGLSRKAAAGGD